MYKKLLLSISIVFASLQIAQAQQKVLIQTSMGDMTVILYDETPKHKENFIKLIKDNFYDSTFFHRVINDFMIQGGDPQSRNGSKSVRLGNGGPGYTLEAEINSKFIHKKGALAAARQGDNVNPERRSSGSQFYIVEGRKWPQQYMPKFEQGRGEEYTEEQKETYETVGGTPHLDGQYTVFGEVIEGISVVDKIAAVETGRADRPTKNIYIIDMKLID